MISDEPIVFGCAGLGGYAAAICNLLEGETARPVKLLAVCEPDHVTHAVKIAELRARGVTVCERFDQLLNEPIEAVWLPLPIHLHRSFTEQALAAGKAVMSEKPAAGCVEDVDAMIAAREAARLPVTVGFQDIYQPETALLKKKLLDGSLGTIRSATLSACWPRDRHYFERSSWVGRFKTGNNWVLDSPAQNALGHFVNLILFFLGSSLSESAVPASVEAELYRVNPIENYDTCALRITTTTGVTAIVLLTHGCTEICQPEITMHGTEGTMRYKAWQTATFTSASGTENIPLARDTNLDAVVTSFGNLVRGESDPSLVATLEIARQHTVVINGASQAAAIHDVPFTVMDQLGNRRVITGIERLFEHCVREQVLPYESGLAPWSLPPSICDLRGYSRFAGPKMNGNTAG